MKLILLRAARHAGLTPGSFQAEAYRVLRTNLHYANPDAPLRRLLITSAGPGEGKIHYGLEPRCRDGPERACRAPGGHGPSPAGAPYTIGSGSRAAPGCPPTWVGDALLDAVNPETAIPNPLDRGPAGRAPPNPAELLASRRMQDFIATVSERFDTIVFDSPPVLAVSDACTLASMVDGSC